MAPEVEKAKNGTLTDAQKIDLKKRLSACVNGK
jgi:hypothetical protein